MSFMGTRVIQVNTYHRTETFVASVSTLFKKCIVCKYFSNAFTNTDSSYFTTMVCVLEQPNLLNDISLNDISLSKIPPRLQPLKWPSSKRLTFTAGPDLISSLPTKQTVFFQ